MWTKVTGKLDKKIPSKKGEPFAGRREEVMKKQNGLKLTNRFTFQEEETCPTTECLMQEDDQVMLGMFIVGKRNIFKVGKGKKLKSIPNEENCGEQSKRENKILARTRKEQNLHLKYFKTENQFKTLSDNSEEDISNIIKRLNILQIKRNSLKKC